MERIKSILIAVLVICATIFASTFLYLKEVASADVYAHMQSQFKEVFEVCAIPIETSILSKDEFYLPLSSEEIKERVGTLFDEIKSNSIYSYDEDSIKEVKSSIESIYEKERLRTQQVDGKAFIFWIRTISALSFVIMAILLCILIKKIKIRKSKKKIM